MIKHLRIDNRLIHGQVANTWIHSSSFDQVVACNDEAAADKLQTQLLLMAVRGVETKILSLEKATKFFLKYPDMQAFVVVKNLQDAWEISEAVPCERINIGNQAKTDVPGRDVSTNVFLTEDDISYLKKFLKKGVDITCQTLPNTTMINMKDVVAKW